MATRADVARRARALPRVAGRQHARMLPRATYATMLGELPPVGMLPPATEAEVMSLPPFGRGVALLANAVASTEWYAAKWDADLGVSVRLPDQPAVLADPDPYTTAWHYKWAATEDGILWGNHFALYGEPDYRTLRAGWLVPIAADSVWILQDNVNPAVWQWVVGGIVFDPDELLHVAFGNRSGEVLGRGVLSQYGEWLGGVVAGEAHSAGYYSGGALPPAVITSPQILTQGQADELKAKWWSMASTREPVVLPSGYTLTPIVSSAEQAQLVESRTWNAEMVAMVLGIPPWKLGLQGPTMTYSNVETADIDFVRDSVDRYAGPLSASYTKWLMPRGIEVIWNYAGRMRADAKGTAEVLAALVGAGILTADEARSVLNRPPHAAAITAGSTPAGVPELTPGAVR